MTLTEYRNQRGLSLSELATHLDLSANSAGHLSRLERSEESFGIKLALQIEAWSEGEVRAVDLLSAEDAELLRAALARGEPMEAAA